MNSSCPTVWQAAVQAFRFVVLLLAVTGSGALAFGADFASSTATNSAFAKHLAQLNRKVPKGFTVVVQPPFVVIGDAAVFILADSRRLVSTLQGVCRRQTR